MKKVYIEVTNNCNLSCSFCAHNKRTPKYMSMEEFKIILKKLNGITKYLYLHVLGEPLMHPSINEMINEASKNYYVNITTNGYYLKKVIDNKNIRQINISLHSCTSNHEKYLDNIFTCVDKLKKYTFINYRLWRGSDEKIISILENKYKTKITTKMKLEPNVFIDIDDGFTWPGESISNDTGTCYALRDHFAILADGTITPCCLDANGAINLGNIFDSDINSVLESKRVKDMVEGFRCKKLVEELCQHCDFITRFGR